MENHQKSGVSWYDYGARFYDPEIARFHTQDRFAEKYLNLTSYHYAANNPIKYVDYDGDSIVWARDAESQRLMQQVLALRDKSTIFATLYDYLDGLSAVINVKANDKEVQKAYQESTKGKDPEGKAGGVTKGNSIVFSEKVAKQDTFSEEFFHVLQGNIYSNSRSTQEKDAEAKLFNTVVGVQIENKNSSIEETLKSIKGVPTSLGYYNGQLLLPLTDAASSGSLLIQQNSRAYSSYMQYLKNFSGLHNQSKNDVYGGKQRSLVPAVYNFVVSKTK